MPDIKVRVGQQNAVKVVASAFGGSLTAEQAVNATNVKVWEKELPVFITKLLV